MRDCDFIPSGYHQARSVRAALIRRASLLIGLVAMMGIWVGAHHRSLASASAMYNEVAHQKDQIEIHAKRKAAMEEERWFLERRELLVRELRNPVPLAVLFAEISHRLPESMMVTQVNYVAPSLARFTVSAMAVAPETSAIKPIEKAAGSAASPVSPAPKPVDRPMLSITGIAPSPGAVIAFAAALETSPLFERIQIVAQSPDEWSGKRVEKFEMNCELADTRTGAP